MFIFGDFLNFAAPKEPQKNYLSIEWEVKFQHNISMSTHKVF